MVRTLAFAVGLSISAHSALGEFVGIEFVEGNSAAASIAIGANAITFQLFAVFDGLGGNLLSTGANLDNTVLLTGFIDINTTGPATFFQEDPPFGSDFAPKSSLFGSNPTLQYDTYATIGVSDGDDPRASSIAQNQNTMTTTHIGGTWLHSNPLNNAGSAVANANLSTGFGTLLFQMTILTNGGAGNFNDINSLVTGTFSVFTQALPPVGFTQHPVVITSVPTPGAMGIFGIAGLVAIRRRR